MVFNRMFGRSMISAATRRVSTPRRFSSGVAGSLYNNVWKKSNVFYITYVVAGCVVVEALYGAVTNFIWDAYNRGVSTSPNSNSPGFAQPTI